MPSEVEPTVLIPAAYDGREQALIKHRLLENYLEKLFLIIGLASRSGGTAELCYVDCFAGPWCDPSEDMESTSISISLKTLSGCRQTLASMGAYVKIRALYVEENVKAFGRLKAYLGASTPRGVQAECMLGDFVALRQDILKWVGPNAFAFFFVDPKGFSEIGIPTLRPLLERPRSEFLINLMYDHLNRVMSIADWQPAMTELLGEHLDLTDSTPEQREKKILAAYRKNLKDCVPSSPTYPARAAHARVMNPDRARPKYHLVYVTSHPLGVVKFMQISEVVDRIQAQVRAVKRDAKKERETGMGELWGAGELVDMKTGHVSLDQVDRFWENYLCNGARRIDNAAFADILERTDWFEGDLQASLVQLIKAGRVVNRTVDAKRRFKRPLHFDERGGETLEWVN